MLSKGINVIRGDTKGIPNLSHDIIYCETLRQFMSSKTHHIISAIISVFQFPHTNAFLVKRP
jgi:hypothetical protein